MTNIKTFPSDSIEGVQIAPYAQGQICQWGRGICRSGNRYFVRSVSRDRSEGQEWSDDGQYKDKFTEKPVVCTTFNRAVMVAAY